MIRAGSSIDEVVLDFLDITPAPGAKEAYWRGKAQRYRAAYEVAQRVVEQQAKMLFKAGRQLAALEKAVRR